MPVYQINKPAEFDWFAHNIYGDGTTDFDFTSLSDLANTHDFKSYNYAQLTSAPVNVDLSDAYFLSPDGDDSNDGLTEATAWATLEKAKDADRSTILVKGGKFYSNFNLLNNWIAGTSKSFIAYDGTPEFYGCNSDDSASFVTDTRTNVYRWDNAPVPASVWDEANPTQFARWGWVFEVASADEVRDATGAAWFHDGTNLFVKLEDNRTPDADVRVNQLRRWNAITNDQAVYFQGINFYFNTMGRTSGTRGNQSMAFVDCEIGYGNEIDNAILSMQSDSIGTLYLSNCHVYNGGNDGISFGNAGRGVIANTTSRDYRLDGANNALTGHDTSVVIALNTQCRYSFNDVTAFIQDSVLLAVGHDSKDSLNSTGGDYNIDTANTKMYMINCSNTGSVSETGGVVGSGQLIQQDNNLTGFLSGALTVTDSTTLVSSILKPEVTTPKLTHSAQFPTPNNGRDFPPSYNEWTKENEKYGYYDCMYVGVDTPNGYLVGQIATYESGDTWTMTGDTAGLAIDSATGVITIADNTLLTIEETRYITVIRVNGSTTDTVTLPVYVVDDATDIGFFSPNGDDSNDGRQPHKPRNTLANSNDFNTRRSVMLFERGAVFEGTLPLRSDTRYGGFGNPLASSPTILYTTATADALSLTYEACIQTQRQNDDSKGLSRENVIVSDFILDGNAIAKNMLIGTLVNAYEFKRIHLTNNIEHANSSGITCKSNTGGGRVAFITCEDDEVFGDAVYGTRQSDNTALYEYAYMWLGDPKSYGADCIQITSEGNTTQTNYNVWVHHIYARNGLESSSTKGAVVIQGTDNFLFEDSELEGKFFGLGSGGTFGTYRNIKVTRGGLPITNGSNGITWGIGLGSQEVSHSISFYDNYVNGFNAEGQPPISDGLFIGGYYGVTTTDRERYDLELSYNKVENCNRFGRDVNNESWSGFVKKNITQNNLTKDTFTTGSTPATLGTYQSIDIEQPHVGMFTAQSKLAVWAANGAYDNETIIARLDLAPNESIVSYQWRLNGRDIDGATSANYAIPVGTEAQKNDRMPQVADLDAAELSLVVTVEDANGNRDFVISNYYRVGFSNDLLGTTEPEVFVFVQPDTTAPVITLTPNITTYNLTVGDAIPSGTATTDDGSTVTFTDDVQSVNRTVRTYTSTDSAGNVSTRVVTFNFAATDAPSTVTLTNTYVVNGSSSLSSNSLGDITASKIQVITKNTTWVGTSGFLYSQASGSASQREFGLALSSGNIVLTVGGVEETLGSLSSNPIINIDLDLTVETSGAYSLKYNGVTKFSGSIARGTGRVAGVPFRFSGRSNLPADTAVFMAESGTKVGDTQIFIDDTLARDYRMPSQANSTAVVDVVGSFNAVLQNPDGTDFETPDQVIDTVKPILTVSGQPTTVIEIDEAVPTFVATATDNLNGDVTARIVQSGDTVDNQTEGAYVLHWDVSDLSGNDATRVTRAVIVTAVGGAQLTDISTVTAQFVGSLK